MHTIEVTGLSHGVGICSQYLSSEFIIFPWTTRVALLPPSKLIAFSNPKVTNKSAHSRSVNPIKITLQY